MTPSPTHEVTNQAPSRVGHDAYAADPALREAVAREGAGWADDALHALGRLVGDAEWIEAGRAANDNPPELLTHDPSGHRIDEVRYHPAYHQLMEAAVSHGLHASAWADDTPGAHIARAARYALWPRIDSGTLCPTTGSGKVRATSSVSTCCGRCGPTPIRWTPCRPNWTPPRAPTGASMRPSTDSAPISRAPTRRPPRAPGRPAGAGRGPRRRGRLLWFAAAGQGRARPGDPSGRR